MAFVLSSVSGNLISAASAGFAPTNSADVSAIASAYQVVSSTATQLYAGTAYLTSVNETPISASRAGNAANASLATSAYYDGTGRLISSLPDEATVSSIASTYAESAASSKQDTLTFDWDSNSAISSINGSALAGQGGGGLITAIGSSESGITSLNNSGLVDTAALRSADYSSLYVQEPLYISASGDSSYIGISGDTQVVTAVGTETAITPDGVGNVVTSINGDYISALSADSAFQATYDDNGRLLTSLASEYDISSIASSYAESAISSVSGDYYSTSNPSGFLTATNSAGGVQVYATGSETSTNQFSAANESAGASLIAGTKARVRLWDSDYTGNMYASSIQTWNNKLDGSAIQYVAGSADATANGVLYILTGNA